MTRIVLKIVYEMGLIVISVRKGTIKHAGMITKKAGPDCLLESGKTHVLFRSYSDFTLKPSLKLPDSQPHTFRNRLRIQDGMTVIQTISRIRNQPVFIRLKDHIFNQEILKQRHPLIKISSFNNALTKLRSISAEQINAISQRIIYFKGGYSAERPEHPGFEPDGDKTGSITWKKGSNL
nr:hypothetical protein [Maridesulfovibrio sp.]